MLPAHQTPFVAHSAVLPDAEGVEQLVVMLKATFEISPTGKLAVAAEQEALSAVDEHSGAAGTSSIARAADIGLPKPLGTDVFLAGHAVAPRGGTRDMEVSLRAGAIHKRARVSGPRAWHAGALGVATHTAPEPFERVRLLYELAFGGEDRSAEDPAAWEGEARNPVGRGFRARTSRAEWRDTPLPNLEDPAALLGRPDERPRPLAFGPIGRHWAPRVGYAGSYDARWRAERMPLLPADFDARFHHAAPPDQILAGHVKGGEAVQVTGCTRSGVLAFELPAMRVTAALRLFLRDVELALACDTLAIDADRASVSLLYRGAVALGGELLDVREVELAVEGVPA
jgi:hypothetical protein